MTIPTIPVKTKIRMHIYDMQTRARNHSTINHNKGRLLLSDLGLRTDFQMILVELITSKSRLLRSSVMLGNYFQLIVL